MKKWFLVDTKKKFKSRLVQLVLKELLVGYDIVVPFTWADLINAIVPTWLWSIMGLCIDDVHSALWKPVWLCGISTAFIFYLSRLNCVGLCCPNCWKLRFIHQLRDRRIWALCSLSHCLVHVGGKWRRRVGAESFILKPFLPHLLVCHRMSGCDTQVTLSQHELESRHWFKPSHL